MPQLSFFGSPGPLRSLATNTLSSFKTSDSLFGSRYVGSPLQVGCATTCFPRAVPAWKAESRPNVTFRQK